MLGMVEEMFDPSTLEAEFEGNLVYRASSRTARAHRETVFKKKSKPNNNNKKAYR